MIFENLSMIVVIVMLVFVSLKNGRDSEENINLEESKKRDKQLKAI